MKLMDTIRLPFITQETNLTNLSKNIEPFCVDLLGFRIELQRSNMKFPVLGGPAESKINVSNRLVWAVLLVISVGWGTSPVAVRIALREGLGPITIASASSMIAAAAVFALMAGLRRGMLIGRVEMRLGGVLAVLSVLVPFQMRNLALENASAGFVSLVSALIPLVTAGMAHFALSDEPLNAPTLASLLLGLGGVFGLISVMSVSAAAVYAKRYAGGYSVLGVTYSTIHRLHRPVHRRVRRHPYAGRTGAAGHRGRRCPGPDRGGGYGPNPHPGCPPAAGRVGSAGP